MSHINGLWHSTAMAADYDALLGPLQHLFGAVVMHDHSSDDPAIGRRGGMIWLGDNSIEIGAPVGDRSPVRGFVDHWGGGMHSLAFQVDDAQETLERLAGLGVRPAAFVDEKIFFTRPGDTAGLLLEWAARHTDDDPRWGHALTPLARPPVVPVEQYAFVTALVTDPVATAQRLAELLGTEASRLRPDAGPDQVGAVVPLVDCLLLLFPLPPPGTGRELWGAEVGRGRLHAHGLRVADLDAALAALEPHGVGVSRVVDGMVFLDPAALPLPTFLCEELLPGDPRFTAGE